jgi:hypothetical protein
MGAGTFAGIFSSAGAVAPQPTPVAISAEAIAIKIHLFDMVLLLRPLTKSAPARKSTLKRKAVETAWQAAG